KESVSLFLPLAVGKFKLTFLFKTTDVRHLCFPQPSALQFIYEHLKTNRLSKLSMHQPLFARRLKPVTAPTENKAVVFLPSFHPRRSEIVTSTNRLRQIKDLDDE